MSCQRACQEQALVHLIGSCLACDRLNWAEIVTTESNHSSAKAGSVTVKSMAR